MFKNRTLRMALLFTSMFLQLGVSTAAIAQDHGEPMADYCERMANETCLNRYGQFTFECQEAEIRACATGLNGGDAKLVNHMV
jgi:hypothetical protein